jgi:hypothetical protein
MTEEDKLKHLHYSFWISVVALLFVSELNAFSLSFAIGILKEIWDKYYGSGFCYFDIAANCIGISIAFFLYHFIFQSLMLA